MDKDKLKSLMTTTEDDVAFATELSDKLVVEKTSELDTLMRKIQSDVVNAQVKDLQTLEYYLLQLTNARYFINSRVDSFGFFDDISKANARDAYNKAYAESQMKAAEEGRKVTNADNQLYAETKSLEDTMLNLIYARAAKIVKGKIESADEMIRTLSKLISAEMQENGISRMSNKIE